MNKFIRAALFALTVAMNGIGTYAATVDDEITTVEPSWIEVDLESAGTLGVEVLYKVDVLNDVEYLRVSGPMNSSDWTSVKNMGNLKKLDLSAASCTEVPASQFSGRSAFNEIILPEGVTSIGKSAFQGSGLTEMTIPSTVSDLGREAFQDCKSLKVLNFPKQSKFSVIPQEFCRSCPIEELVLPEGVTTISSDAFYYCENLVAVTLPETLEYIGSMAFYHASALNYIDLPDNLATIKSHAFSYSGLKKVVLPKKITELGVYAFESCKSLEELELSASMLAYTYSFQHCSALKKIISPAATPPTVEGTFSNVNMSQVTLCVPSFAVVNYKLDSFWMQCGSIEGGITSDYWYVNSDLTLSGERRMEGTPDVTVGANGRFTISGSSSQAFNVLEFNSTFDYNNNRRATQPAQIINRCESVTANRLSTTFDNLRYNEWHFITVPHEVKVSEITHSDATAQFVFRYYDGESRAANGTGASWKDVDADGVLQPGIGYIMMTDKQGSLTFPATTSGIADFFAVSDITIAAEPWASENAANAGWNYVGNPYPSFYDLYYTGLVCPVTVRTGGNNYTAYSLIDDNVVLYPYQAFFFQNSGDEGTLTFPLQGRQFTTEIARPALSPAMSGDAARSLFNFELRAGEKSDRTRVVLNADASEIYEAQRDAAKFFSEDPANPQLWTVNAHGDALAINERADNGSSVALGLYLPEAGEYTLALTRCDGLAAIYDAQSGQTSEITVDKPYVFSASEAGSVERRFSLVLNPGETTAVSGVAVDRSADIRGNGREISADADFTVFTADGRVVATAAAGCTVELLPGAYIVNAAGTSTKCVVK